MLQITFVVKDLGSLHFFLGVKAYFTVDELFLTQQNYICDHSSQVQYVDCQMLAYICYHDSYSTQWKCIIRSHAL